MSLVDTQVLGVLLDAVTSPIAVFVPAELPPVMCNAAWRKHMARVPVLVWERIAASAYDMSEPQSLVVSHDVAGTPAHYSAHVQLLHDSLGAPSGVIVTCVDITERAVAERFEAPRGALIWGGPLLAAADYHNGAWQAYAGEASDWEAIVDRADLERCRAALQQASRQRQSTPIEARLCRTDGAVRWHQITFAVVADEARWYGIARDVHDARNLADERNELISAARTARADAELATRLKDEFIARVSHELRAP
jgi:signal transduction histidine kinase